MTTVVIAILLNLGILNGGTTQDANVNKNLKPVTETSQTPGASTNGGTGTWTEKR